MTLASITQTSRPDLPEQRINAVRQFNRFYTRRIGVLHAGYLHSPFSLTQVRVLYELAHRQQTTATELGRELDLDRGYLSRILHGFLERGLLERTRSERDGRESWLSLNERGRRAFEPLDSLQREEIGALLAPLDDHQQQRLVSAMSSIQRLLGGARVRGADGYTLRGHQPGDLGWVVQRHAELYAQEYGFDVEFEALVASIVARFIQQYDARRERCWIAEHNGERLGCVFLVKGTKTVAKLRLFLVEPDARGQGIGSHLVDECIRFARAAGYRKLRLWTQSVLLAARHIYARAGFQLVDEQPHHSYSQDLVAETWELRL